MNDLQRAKKAFFRPKIQKSHKIVASYPKKNKSAYIFFTQEYKSMKPDIHLNFLMKEIALKWSQLLEKEREPYIKLAQKDKKRYFMEKKRFLETSVIFTPKIKKKRGKTTPYLLYSRAIRYQISIEKPDLNPAELMREIAERWRTLSDELRKPYYDLYEKGLEEKRLLRTHEIESFFQNIKHKKRKKTNDLCIKRKKRSPFLDFCKEVRQNDPIKAFSASELADKWNGLKSIEKEKYYETLEEKGFLQEKIDFLGEKKKGTGLFEEKISFFKEQRDFLKGKVSLKDNEEDLINKKVNFNEEKRVDSGKTVTSLKTFFSDYDRFLEAKRKSLKNN